MGIKLFCSNQHKINVRLAQSYFCTSINCIIFLKTEHGFLLENDLTNMCIFCLNHGQMAEDRCVFIKKNMVDQENKSFKTTMSYLKRLTIMPLLTFG